LSAVRDYSLNEFVLRFSYTVYTFGREGRECVMRQAAGTKSNKNGMVYGLPKTACTIYVHTSVMCVANCFMDLLMGVTLSPEGDIYCLIR